MYKVTYAHTDNLTHISHKGKEVATVVGLPWWSGDMALSASPYDFGFMGSLLSYDDPEHFGLEDVDIRMDALDFSDEDLAILNRVKGLRLPRDEARMYLL